MGAYLVWFISRAVIRGKKSRAWIGEHPEAAYVVIEKPAGAQADIRKVNGQKNAAYLFRDDKGRTGFAFLPGTSTLHYAYQHVTRTVVGRKYFVFDGDVTIEAPAGSFHLLTFHEETHTVTVQFLGTQ